MAAPDDAPVVTCRSWRPAPTRPLRRARQRATGLGAGIDAGRCPLVGRRRHGGAGCCSRRSCRPGRLVLRASDEVERLPPRVPEGWRALGAVALGWRRMTAPGRSAARPRAPVRRCSPGCWQHSVGVASAHLTAGQIPCGVDLETAIDLDATTTNESCCAVVPRAVDRRTSTTTGGAAGPGEARRDRGRVARHRRNTAHGLSKAEGYLPAVAIGETVRASGIGRWSPPSAHVPAGPPRVRPAGLAALRRGAGRPAGDRPRHRGRCAGLLSCWARPV